MTISFTDAKSLNHDQLEEGTAFAPRFDAHGLITVVTLEDGSNDVLMVAHMNAETLSLTLESGIAHYWSRSRKAIWKKGETSGEMQEVIELRTDCDQDCLVMVVRQTGRGAACHTGRKSCFYRKVIMTDGTASLEDTGLPRLFDPEAVYGG
ncbi:phosphoribosyl-AMP cyclohydrolase [Devosia sp. XJ19-1]|uniref:Phosphoribosyl-AMP cyclohydrolase n=1 Tax=Devosia ureilytica TaxID=2952754 RepID=A0A9Q4AMA0_9HYPH|nr:phosphoribosyl-AMP cyclohydrolase [Devosia ureilytica]MCP8881888.1 phosphoribosyl-AMP cyclohydrolase [Devosia ureilytica]MCP8886226.1 phosphoribosyl-AMP cyclohydrolase [Devosia ureilytica]